MQPVGFRRLTF